MFVIFFVLDPWILANMFKHHVPNVTNQTIFLFRTEKARKNKHFSSQLFRQFTDMSRVNTFSGTAWLINLKVSPLVYINLDPVMHSRVNSN
jgi:hypothetical protein